MCFRFLTRLKEICGCCWLVVWNFIVCIFCCLCRNPLKREEKTTDDEKKDKDSKSRPAESSGSKDLEPKAKEPNSAKSDDEDKDSKSGPAESSGSKDLEPKEKEPNSEKSEDEEKTTLPSDNRESIDSIKVLTPLQSGFTGVFFKHFEKKLQKIGFNATVVDFNEFNVDATFNDVVLVICHNHSRLEEDVKNAVIKMREKLKTLSFEKIFLIVLHAWTLTTSPILPSKFVFEDHIEFQKFYNIVDIAFSTSSGIQDFEPRTEDAFKAFQCLKKDIGS